MRVNRFIDRQPTPVTSAPNRSDTVNICGAIVHARPDALHTARLRLDGMDGVETHGAEQDGRIVVTLEDTDQVTAIDQLRAIGEMDGILSVSLVYHQFEPRHSLDKEEVTP